MESVSKTRPDKYHITNNGEVTLCGTQITWTDVEPVVRVWCERCMELDA